MRVREGRELRNKEVINRLLTSVPFPPFIAISAWHTSPRCFVAVPN